MFLNGLAGGIATTALGLRLSAEETVTISAPQSGEDVFTWVQRTAGRFDRQLCAQVLGAANEHKEGDEILGVAAHDEQSRIHARRLLENTLCSDIDARPVFQDQLFEYANASRRKQSAGELTLRDLKKFLLQADEQAIRATMTGLSSDVIGCVVRLMSNQELIAVSRRIFNPLPGSNIGARGYLGARIQPNSPTDNIDDIRWQVLNGWSYGVGDVLLGTNPVSSETESVAAVQQTLKDLLDTFEISDLMPHCVLSHIDVQAEVEQQSPGLTELWFQSIGGTDSANETFDISVEKMHAYAEQRTGRYGLYFETGQGADFTNGHGHGFDMVLHESRKYGFARALAETVKSARGRAAWVHLNDVAGFIGPEVFRTKEQLVRCCLEDIVMGKLHGLTIGLDVCSTLHMDISLQDLDWCLDQILPANPAYLMALPTKIDPMLGYLTTGYQDHVRLREKFGYRVNDSVWQFLQRMNVVRADGSPGAAFGNPLALFVEYRRRKGDTRSVEDIEAEGRGEMQAVRDRGLFLAEGHGSQKWDPAPKLQQEIQRIYDDAKLSIWAELNDQFIESLPNALSIRTKSEDRSDYILHPAGGEELAEESAKMLQQLKTRHAGSVDVQIVVSDGLNALAIMEPGHLEPFLRQVRLQLDNQGYRVANELTVLKSGRVRAGYRIGETLFGGLPGRRAVLHVIGERPGSGHRTFSIYITAPAGRLWGQKGRVDHNITKVVSGVAATALEPLLAAETVVKLLSEIVNAETD